MMGTLIEQVVGNSVSGVLDGILVAAAAWAFLRVAGTRNSGLRFAVWFSALLAIVAVFGFRNSSAVTAYRGLPEILIPSTWAMYLFAGWAVLAAIALARVGVGLWRLQRIHRDSLPIDTGLLKAVAESAPQPWALTRGASIRISDHVRVPTAIGFFRPAVLLPKWALEELSPKELGAVLLHEFAHLRRWDDWTNLAQKVIRALLFFHPAVWWVDGRLSIEREMSCDDRVLAESNNPRSYAECLVTVAERGYLRRPVALAQAAVSRMKHTAKRISKILDGRQRSVTSIWKPALGALTFFMVLGATVVEHTPQLVGFANPAQSRQSARSSDMPSESAGLIVPVVARVDQGFVTRASRRMVRHAIQKKSLAANDSRMVAEASWPVRRQHAQFRGRRDVELSPDVAQRNAHVLNASQNQKGPAFMVVVFQTQGYDNSGNLVVRTYVWRIPVPAQTAADPRST